MNKHKIEIIVKTNNSDHISGIFLDYFGRENSPASPVYVNSEAKYIPTNEGGIKILFSDPGVYEESSDESIFRTQLAKIFIQPYPDRTIVVIDGVKGAESDWQKVENIVREVVARIELLNFEIVHISPSGLIPKNSPTPLEQERGSQRPEKPFEDKTGWDQVLVEMWNKGYQCGEIASKVKVSPARVTNRISELRAKYGHEMVPYDRERKKRLINS